MRISRFTIFNWARRQHFSFMKGEPQTPADGKPIDMFEFITYCARQGIAGAELTSYFFPLDAGADYFRRLKQHAFRQGVTICGTAIGNDFSQGPGDRLAEEISAAKSWIDRAIELGAPHVRFFAGTAAELAQDLDHFKYALDALQRCANHAAERGVFIGVENHGNLTADQMLLIVNGVQSDWFGFNLDTGNFQSDDPYRDLERCAPYAVNVQVKVKMKHPDGTKYYADLDRVAAILKSANYKGFLVLEYEEDNPLTQIPAALATMRRCFFS